MARLDCQKPRSLVVDLWNRMFEAGLPLHINAAFSLH